MRTVRTIAELRAAVAARRVDGQSVGLVPTMGSFHAGHLSLMAAAREACDAVVVSLFVNPTQFGAGEDLDAYPRDEARDAERAAAAGVDLLFAPPVTEIYPDGFATAVTVRGITEVLCGDPDRRGPGHFDGVATVVTKLLNIVAPDVAYFGRKDAQQVAVIRRLVRDLDIPVRIEALATVREPDGLALSSRNAYLTAAERQRATALHRALIDHGHLTDPDTRGAPNITPTHRRPAPATTRTSRTQPRGTPQRQNPPPAPRPDAPQPDVHRRYDPQPGRIEQSHPGRQHRW